MKHTNRAICLILATAVLFLTACHSGGQKSGGDTPGQTGRYVETEITPPIDGLILSFPASDGTIVCFSEGLTMRYESADGGANWTESPGPGKDNPMCQDIRAGALLPDGNVLTYIQGIGLVKISPDGSSEPYPVADIDKATEDGEFAAVSLLQPLGNDRLLISYNIGGIVVQRDRPGEAEPQEGTPAQNVIGSAPVGRMRIDSAEGESSPQPNGREADYHSPESREADQGEEGTHTGYAFSGDMTSKTLLLQLTTAAIIADMPIESAMAATADDENFYLIDMQGNIHSYRLSDGSASDKLSVNLSGSGGIRISGGSVMLPMMGSGGDILEMNGDGGLYVFYDRCLLLCGSNEDISSVLESTAYSIGTPGSSADSVMALPDGSIVINMREGMETNRLYKYAWDENAAINPDKTLSVWSLEENAFVRAAIAQLRKRNPDSYISFEVALSGDNAVSAADAIKTLNTQLLSGSGPDVIILDGCPMESYADKGMLLDLSGIIDTGDIYQNLLAPYITDGKIYCLPAQFIMPALIGEEDALSKARTLDELIDLVINGNDAGIGTQMPGPFAGIPEDERAELYFEDLDELYDIMWLSAAPAIVRDNRLDTDALRRFLEAIKTISDKYGLADPGDEFTMSMSMGFSDGGQTTILPGSLVRYTSQMTNYGAFSAGNLMILQVMMERETSGLAPFPGLVPGAWRPSTVTGISADTSVPDFAAELLRTMLSIEVQQINYGAGLPVTREGIAFQIEEVNKNTAESGRGAFNIDIDALIEGLNEPSVNDATLTEMIRGSVENLCMGNIDVEGAVKEIEQNIKNYLAERA